MAQSKYEIFKRALFEQMDGQGLEKAKELASEIDKLVGTSDTTVITKEEIMETKDSRKRTELIKENIELFRGGK